MTEPPAPSPACHTRQPPAFLTRMGLAALGGPALLEALAACGSSGTTAGGSGATRSALKIATPASPVTWSIYDNNPPIAAGLQPERGATLRL